MWFVFFRPRSPSRALPSRHVCCCVSIFTSRASISLAWVLLCLRNLDAVFMLSGPFMVLNSLQLESCTFDDVRRSLMLLSRGVVATCGAEHLILRLIVQATNSGALPFSASVSHILDLLPFFSPRCFFCWRQIAAEAEPQQ